MMESGESVALVLPQLLSGLAVAVTASVVGGWICFPSLALPALMQSGWADLHSGSWLAAAFFAGNLLGCLTGGLIRRQPH